MMTADPIPLQQETEFFEAHREEWVRENPGKWAVVRGTELLGFFDDVGEGYSAGLERYGNVPFLVKRVTKVDDPEIIQRVYF